MLLPVSALLAHVPRLARLAGQPAPRDREVAAVRARLRGAARDSKSGATDEMRALAAEIRALKPQVLQAFDGVRACAGCGRGRPEPHGHWHGGFCCGGATEGVFTDDEVSALALAGTRPRDLVPPAGDHAGCAFRGPAGCNLGAAHRPALCVRFVCRELEAELRADGRWTEVRALTRRLETAFRAFTEARDRATY